MPIGVTKFNHKKLKEVLSEVFDTMNVGDRCTMNEILEYLAIVPLGRMKDVHPRTAISNRKVGIKQLYTSRDYFAMACGQLPNVVRGSLYSRGSKYMVPLVLFVKTNENMDTVCFNCDEYIVGGAKDYVPTHPKEKMPVMARHIMCIYSTTIFFTVSCSLHSLCVAELSYCSAECSKDPVSCGLHIFTSCM